MSEHYIVTLDRDHLRIYAEHRDDGASASRLEAVESMDFPGTIRSYTLSGEIDTFLQNRPTATWDFAAPAPELQTVMGDLSPETIRRLQRSLSKDLVNQNAEEVRAQFAAVG